MLAFDEGGRQSMQEVYSFMLNYSELKSSYAPEQDSVGKELATLAKW